MRAGAREKGLTTDSHRKSNIYAAAQATLIVVFAAVCFLAPGPRLFAPMIFAGTAIGVFGLIIIGTAIVSLREVIQISPEPREGGRLITSGIYDWLRHPIYSGVVLAVIGLFLREPGAFVAIAGMIVIAFLVVKSRFEETLLLQKYSDYTAYRKRTLW
jgi:protein-S-isoprenylcysteine O-methyltransferase Ste14